MAEVIDTLSVETPPGGFHQAAGQTIPIEQRTDVTVDELERMSLPHPTELYNGKVVFKNISPKRDIIKSNLKSALKFYLQRNHIGAVTTETGFQLWPDRPKDLRIPDVAFIKRERLPKEARRFPMITPDVIAEITTPQDTFSGVISRIEDYLEQGARMVWLIVDSRRLREVMVWTIMEKQMEGQRVRDILTAPELLPGFELPVDKIFEGLS